MIDHANELRRHARKIGPPHHDVPSVMLAAADEIKRLQAKIERMEKQEPGACLPLSGAQPEPSGEDDAVRKSWARFSNELHRSPDAPYPGMSEAFEKHFSQSFTDREWRAESGTWAAAWKAAKNHDAQPAPSVPDAWKKDLFLIKHAMAMNNWNWNSEASDDLKREAYAAIKRLLAAAPEAKP